MVKSRKLQPTLAQLKKEASRLKIKGRSKLNKAGLLAAIARHKNGSSKKASQKRKSRKKTRKSVKRVAKSKKSVKRKVQKVITKAHSPQFRLVMAIDKRGKCGICKKRIEGQKTAPIPKIQKWEYDNFTNENRWKNYHIKCLFDKFKNPRGRCTTHVIQSPIDYKVEEVVKAGQSFKVPASVIKMVNKLAAETHTFREKKCGKFGWDPDRRAYHPKSRK